MVIFLYGSDIYRLKQARDELIGRYKAKYSSGMNLFVFDLSEDHNLEELEKALKTISFFQEHKLIVCNNAFNKKTASDKVAELNGAYKPKDDKDITFMIVEGSSSKELETKNKKFFQNLSSGADIVKIFEPLYGAKLTEWINKEIISRSCSMKPVVIKELIDGVGSDSQALINEIDKLTAYKAGGEITAVDVKILVSAKNNLNIFDLIDALGFRNQKKAAELLYQELKTDRDPYYILTMIVYQFRNLIAVRDLSQQGCSESEISRRAKLHPFVVKKLLKSPFSQDEAVKIYGNLLFLDTGFKNGQLDLVDGLYKLLLH